MQALIILAVVIGIAAIALGLTLFCLIIKFVIIVPRHLEAIADILEDMANK